MNYQKIYNQIIERRRIEEPNGYTETHHIIPRSLGGGDDKDNLVRLTAREHFICHYLLAKIYCRETAEWYKMNHAFLMMKCNNICQRRYYNSRLYEALRVNFSSVMSVTQSGKGNSQYGTMWICNVELQENKKIKKESIIPDGWVKGRDIWKSTPKECLECGRIHFTPRKYCSNECQQLSFSKREKISILDGREEEFLSLYSQNKSINKSLLTMGYSGKGGYYHWAKRVLNRPPSPA